MKKIQAYLSGHIIFSNDSDAFTLSKNNFFGEPSGRDKIQYSFTEALYLVEKDKIEILSSSGKIIGKKEFLKRLQSLDKKINIKYAVFRDLREKGYIVKTALKFGADFRIYDRGQKPGKHHSKWLAFADYETNKTTWHDFSAKNRVAHSTKKALLLCIVDEEGDITYYEINWAKI